jgi:DNA polymerase-3 subunit alpha
MLAVQLEDLTGGIEIVVFPKTYAATSDRWREDAVLLVTGLVKMGRDDEPQLIADEVEEFAVSEEEANRREYLVRIHLQRTMNTAIDLTVAQDVLTALRDFPGDDRFELYVRNGHWEARMPAPNGADGVRFCPELMQQLEKALGPNSVEAIPVVRDHRAAVSVS